LKLEALALTGLLLTLFAGAHMVSAQQEDPCLAAPVHTIADGAQIRGSMNGTLDNRFYLLSGLNPAQRLDLNIRLESNATVSTNTAVFLELGPKNFARIAGDQATTSQGLATEFSYSWLQGRTKTAGGARLCVKVGHFSEVFKPVTNFTITMRLTDLSDYGGGDAPDIPMFDDATALAQPSKDRPVSLEGYLSSRGDGNDHGDLYRFTAKMSRGTILTALVEAGSDMLVEASLLGSDKFGLRYNKTTLDPNDPGHSVASLKLQAENPGDYTFYLRIYNSGGLGGGGRYSVRLSLEEPAPSLNQTTRTETLQPPLGEETARFIVIGGTAAVAAIAVAAVVVGLRRRKAEEFVEYEYY